MRVEVRRRFSQTCYREAIKKYKLKVVSAHYLFISFRIKLNETKIVLLINSSYICSTIVCLFCYYCFVVYHRIIIFSGHLSFMCVINQVILLSVVAVIYICCLLCVFFKNYFTILKNCKTKKYPGQF